MGARHNIEATLEEGEFVLPTTAVKRIFNLGGHGRMFSWGNVVPIDASTGYGKGCIFLHTDAAGFNDTIFINIGSTTSSNFDSVTVITSAALDDDIELGASGTSGSLKVFPSTAARGSLLIDALDNTGDTITTIRNAAHGQATVISIPDPGGATGTFMLLEGTQTVAGNLTISAVLAITGGDADLQITGQAGSASAGGDITVTAGAGDATNAGGENVMVGGGSGNGATGNGGLISVTGGAALSTNGSGGPGSVVGGVATGTGTGGAVAVTAGASAGAGGTAGSVTINAGALAGGTAGQVNIAKSDDELGFYGVSAIVRPTAYTQTLSTADKTHANRTAATLTDNSGGTANTTIADITEANNAGSADRVPTEDAIADLAAQVNALIVDQLDTAAFVNSVVDDLQVLGLLQ